MKLHTFSIFSTLTLAIFASPIPTSEQKRAVNDVATVLIGVSETNNKVSDVATVLIGVSEKRGSHGPNDKRAKEGVADVATVLIGVAGHDDAEVGKREAAVSGAYAEYVKEAEAHAVDILGE